MCGGYPWDPTCSRSPATSEREDRHGGGETGTRSRIRHGPCSTILDSSHSFAATPQARLPPGKRAVPGTMASAALISSPLTNRGWTHPLTSSCENRAPPTMWTETLEAVTGRFGSSGWGPLERHSAASSSVLVCICGLVLEPGKWALDPTSGAVRTTRTTTAIENGTGFGARFPGSKNGPQN